MNCDFCNSERVLRLNAKSSDRNTWEYGGRTGNSYLPVVANLCGGDYVRVAVCLNCGKAQGRFPVEADGILANDPKPYFWDNYSRKPEFKYYYLGCHKPYELCDEDGGDVVAKDFKRLHKPHHTFVRQPLIGNPTWILIDEDCDMISEHRAAKPNPGDYDMEEI